MKSTWFSVLTGTLVVFVVGIIAIFANNYYRANIEQRAYELMTQATQALLETADWNPVLENMTAEAPIQTADMSSLGSFGRLVTLGEMEGVADVPSPFSGRSATAQLRMAGHFTNGICYTEAILVYQNGGWLFSHFAYIPGEFAQ